MRKFLLVALFCLISAAAYADNPVIPFLTNNSTGDVEQKADKDGLAYTRTKIDVVSITNLGTANTYSANQAIGNLQTVAAPDQTAFLQSVTVTFASQALCPCDLRIFNANPTGSTLSDHTTAVVVAADATKISGTVHISDCTTDTVTSCQSQNQMIPFSSTATTAPFNIYVSLIARGAGTIALNDVNIRLRFIR